jgi:hypothetical protein
MAERNRTDEWTISGTGEKPSLTFRIEMDAKLTSEDDPEKWSKDNPQPK